MALNARQRAFVEAYCGNATEAAIAAGYSAKYAGRNADKLLKNTKVQEALKEREDKRLASLIATRERRQRFWTEVMENPNEDMKERLKASELLAKSEGDFIERREITGPNGAPIHPPEIKVIFSDEAD